MAGGLGPAYGQTDVMHDRSYLISQMANRNRAVRQQAAAALDNLDRQEALQQRDIALQQRQMAQEATQRRITAHQNAMEMDKQLKIDRDTEIDEQGHGLLLSMMKLDAAKRRGEIDKNQYDQGLLDAASQFPLGLKHPEAKKHFEFVTQEADRQNAFNARRQATEAIKLSSKYGVPVQTDPTTGLPSVDKTRALAANTPQGQVDFGALRLAPEKINQRYAHVKGMLDQRTQEQSGITQAYNADVKRQEALNAAANPKVAQSNVPYNPRLDEISTRINEDLSKTQAQLKGYQTEKQQLEAAYPQLNQSNQIQNIQQTVATPTPSPEPSPTPDTRPVQGFDIPILSSTTPAPSATPVSTPSPSPEATAAPATTPVHLGKYNPVTGEFE